VLQSADCAEQLTAMANRGDSMGDQIFGREVGQDLSINVVLAERLLVLSQPQATQPDRDVYGSIVLKNSREVVFDDIMIQDAAPSSTDTYNW
jgi:predicted nuclease with RNAse H fold